MSYAEAKQIALARLELRTCWDLADHRGAAHALARLSAIAGSDADLIAEVRRWTVKLGAHA